MRQPVKVQHQLQMFHRRLRILRQISLRLLVKVMPVRRANVVAAAARVGLITAQAATPTAEGATPAINRLIYARTCHCLHRPGCQFG